MINRFLCFFIYNSCNINRPKNFSAFFNISFSSLSYRSSLSSFFNFSSSGLRLPLPGKGVSGDFLYLLTHPCIVVSFTPNSSATDTIDLSEDSYLFTAYKLNSELYCFVIYIIPFIFSITRVYRVYQNG